MSAVKLLALVLLSLAVLPVRADPADLADERILLVAVLDDTRVADSDFTSRYQHLLAYRFLGDTLAATDTVVSSRGGQLRFTCERSRVYRNRYVLCDTGDIIDVVEGEMVYEGGHDRDFTRFERAEGDDVIIRRPGYGSRFSVSLPTGSVTMLAAGTDTLPGTLSPGGTRSVTSRPTDHGGEIWLHTDGAAPRLLGRGFDAQVAMLSSSRFGAPLYWLDEERVLTQRASGEIVILHLDGVVEPVVTIDLPKSPTLARLANQYPTTTSQEFACMAVSFEADPYEAILYRIGLVPIPDRGPVPAYAIDVDAKTYRPVERTWLGLGHEFEIERENHELPAVRYRGQEVWWRQPIAAYECQTAPRVIAFVPPQRYGRRDAFTVWFADANHMVTCEVPAGGVLTSNALIGWVLADESP
jgi:hypothetical protein